jgi:hypothetical protein
MTDCAPTAVLPKDLPATFSFPLRSLQPWPFNGRRSPPRNSLSATPAITTSRWRPTITNIVITKTRSMPGLGLKMEVRSTDKITETKVQKNHAEKTHYCELRKRSFATAGRQRDHKKSKKHLNKADGLANNRYQCTACAKGFTTNDYLQRHLKTKVHLKVLAALSSPKLD